MDELLKKQYAFRDALVEYVRRDLIGPQEPAEVLNDPPVTTFIVGVLYPRSDETVADATEELESEDGLAEDSAGDPPVASSNRRFPTTMGITFAVDPSVSSTIQIEVQAARYQPLLTEGASDDGTEDGEQKWQRIPLEFDPVEVDVTTPGTHPLRPHDKEDLELYVRVRESDGAAVPVTVALINRRSAPGWEKDADSYFQPSIRVTGEAGTAPFVERRDVAPSESDEDLRSYRLLFREARGYAVGHGCAAMWEDPDSNGRTNQVRTEFLPSHEVSPSESIPNPDIPPIPMRLAATGERKEFVSRATTLADDYAAWITSQDRDKDGLESDLQEVAASHIAECERALARIRAGISMLDRDDRAWQAFELANRAMLKQRATADWLNQGRPEAGIVEDESHVWRPFQVAFILTCLPGLIDSSLEERKKADLLWFPTGGGKTEAYLGLIAFTIFLRRLRDDDGGGVTALMRYTLRLLTIQQFQRAAMLICACEAIRRERDDLGGDEIAIGLWIGGDGSPNDRQRTRIALDKLKAGQTVEKGSPIQLHRCPWCGVALDAQNYWLASHDPRLVISCGNENCIYEKALPVYVVDEDIYERHPALLISTVDKFANLPWNETVAEIFNLNDGRRPPELIVQDELHLISGPLGTLTGLYETAIDFLCADGEARPKVIASTATIRRAGAQLHNLFDREIAQFPPQGLSSNDSYFAVQSERESKGTRLYAGLMAAGGSHTTLMVRVYAALLQAVQSLDAEDAVKDPYWTLVGYFNSLRVLGGARMQVQDDIVDRIGQIARGSSVRAIEETVELTSREDSSRIPERLEQMTVSRPDEDAIDVILATNMISVGVDVDRLGLMVVMGQPQATAEYIQATSRVGRQHPGLIFTLLNPARSRDRSHYESFVPYHSALYRQVESSSVTPFSARARDRALHALLISLARMKLDAFRKNSDARAITDEKNEAELRALATEITRRVRSVDPNEADEVELELQGRIADWRARAEQEPKLVYSDRRHPERALMIYAGDADEDHADQLPTLTSMRDVDLEAELRLIPS